MTSTYSLASKVTLGVDIQIADGDSVEAGEFVLYDPGLEVTYITSAHIPLARIRLPTLDWY